MSRTDRASERRSENRPALQRRYSKTKRDPPSRRAGVKRRKLLFSTKNREAWSFFSAELVIRIIFRRDGSPRPSGTGPIWNRQVTGAEVPAYYQGVPPDFAKASSGRPGRYF